MTVMGNPAKELTASSGSGPVDVESVGDAAVVVAAGGACAGAGGHPLRRTRSVHRHPDPEKKVNYLAFLSFFSVTLFSFTKIGERN